MSTIPGYSGTPQLNKLGIGIGTRLDVINRPEGWTFEPQPDGAVLDDTGQVDVLLAFVTSVAELADVLESAAQRIFPAGALWVAWPRRAAGHVSDLSDTVVRSAALELGLVDVKVAAIDTDWSGLKIVWRRENRRR